MKKVAKLFCLIILTVTALVACQKNDVSNRTVEIVKKEKISMKLIESPGGLSEEVKNYVENLLTTHHSLGEEGKFSVNYGGATQGDGEETYALFLLINRTDQTFDKQYEFNITWGYDDFLIYDNQVISYDSSEIGILEPNSVAIMYLPVTAEQEAVIDQMTDLSKYKLEISNLHLLSE